MDPIAFLDSEIERGAGKIKDIGAIRDNGDTFHSSSVSDFIRFAQGTRYVCGHNIIHHDLTYLRPAVETAGISEDCCIDTLYWSPLLFPARPYHALLKDDKLQTDDLNNPLNDAIKARDLFYDEVAAFRKLPSTIQSLYYALLHERKEFGAFFGWIGYEHSLSNPEQSIRETFSTRICQYADLAGMISEHPVELAYALASIHANNRYSITPPWVLKNYPGTERMFHLLRNKPCLAGCAYCNDALDVRKGLKRFFGFAGYRSYGGEPLQEQAVRAAVAGKSLLAVFPTGGGKSITFQVPALMSGLAGKD